MSEWQRVKFEDLLVGKKISYGVVQPGQFQEVGGVPLIRVNNIKNAKVDVSDIVKIHEDVEAKYSKTRLCGGELLITVVGSVGECAIVTAELKGFNVARAVSVANIVDGVDKRFVAYQFRTEDLKFQMYGNTNDTVQPTLNLTELKQLTFTLPPLPEQKAIASVLSSLDDKIDLLHRQNKTLEAMAETLFRQWFIEEAKEDWEVSSLGDVVKIAYGKNLPTSRLLDSGYPVFGGNGQIGFYDRFLYSEPQVLVSCRGEASGKVNISLPNSFITNNSLVLERKENGISFEYLKFYALAYDFGLHVSGSAQPQITIDGLFNAEFRWPPLDLVESFTEVVRPLEDKRLTNYVQIQTLENLRDTLLPKLMSGEVRVQYQTEEVA